MCAIGVLGFRYLDRRPPAPTLAVPAVVTIPIAAPVIPAPVVNVTTPPPPAPPPEPQEITPPARALTPFLDAECIAITKSTSYGDADHDDTTPKACGWEDGFPAISADGKTIAMRYSHDDGNRGWPNLAVTFVDVETSRVISDETIVGADELDDQGRMTDKLRARVNKRVPAIQKRLDEGHYRTMQYIDSAIPDPGVQAPPGLRLEHEERSSRARIVDGHTNTVIWRGEFDVTNEYPPRKIDPDADTGCYPSNTGHIDAWFDPQTRQIALLVSYGSAPCYCSNESHVYVRRATSP